MKRIYKKFLSKVHSYSWDTFDVHELSVRLRQAEPSDLPLLYSLIIKIIKRMTGFTLFDSQIVAAYAMQSGKIAQLPTGEGKTLAAVLVAAASALQGRHVHIFTVNDYLAIRDYETSCEIFCRCGLTSSCIIERSSLSDKKKAYESEILYITAKQAGFELSTKFSLYGSLGLFEKSLRYGTYRRSRLYFDR